MDKAEIISCSRYRMGIRYMTLVDDCIKRIGKVASWPEGKMPDQIQHVFPAFCEYVAFNMGIKYPFFEALYYALRGKEALLFKHICNNDFKGSILLVDEAYEIMTYLGIDNVRAILDIYMSYGSLSSDTYISICESLKKKDYSTFSDTICKGDLSDLLCKLGLLRYILLGSTKGKILEKYNIEYCNWFSGCDWEDYFKENENDCTKKQVSSIIRERILGISRRRTSVRKIRKLELRRIPNLIKINYELLNNNKCYYDGWLKKWESQANLITSDLEVTDLLIREGEISSTCQHMANEIMFTSFYNHPEKVEEYLTGITEKSQVDDFFRSKAQDFLQKSPKERWVDLYLDDSFNEGLFSDYILLMLYKIAKVFTFVSGFVDVKEREFLEWVLQRSSYYNVFTVIKQQSREERFLPSEHSSQKLDSLSAALEKWADKTPKNNKGMGGFTITPQLSGDQIESLLKGLSEKGYVHERTTKDTLLYILGGGKKPSSFNPIIWVKKTSKNSKVSKRSLLNFLRLLGVDWKELKPSKLNYYFLCFDGNKYSEFDSNNMTEKRNPGIKCAESEYNEELKTIIKEALGEHCFICSHMEGRRLSE